MVSSNRWLLPALATVILALGLGMRTSAVAAVSGERVLRCGVPVRANLAAGEVHEYRLEGFGPGPVVVDAIDVTGGIDLMALSSEGTATCRGWITARGDGPGVAVQDCLGSGEGSYVIVANPVSASAASCLPAMPCGEVPYDQTFALPGAVRGFSFTGDFGDRISLWARQSAGQRGPLWIRLFDPSGEMLAGRSESCGDLTDFRLPSSGRYTVLISACGGVNPAPWSSRFRSASCPSGPEISFLGLARADGVPLPSRLGTDGRIRVEPEGRSGFQLVVEALPGRSGVAVGDAAVGPDARQAPDVQVVFSRPLGNGSRAVCDRIVPNAGGVPASPDFSSNPTVIEAMNDFGCRFDDGAGSPRGRPPVDACTQGRDGEPRFLGTGSTLQFCSVITTSLAFPVGETTLQVRLRDLAGNVGPIRQLVVATRSSNGETACPADCDGDGEVVVTEIIRAIVIALGEAELASCLAADADGDGFVSIVDIIAAVNAALAGCP